MKCAKVLLLLYEDLVSDLATHLPLIGTSVLHKLFICVEEAVSRCRRLHVYICVCTHAYVFVTHAYVFVTHAYVFVTHAYVFVRMHMCIFMFVRDVNVGAKRSFDFDLHSA